MFSDCTIAGIVWMDDELQIQIARYERRFVYAVIVDQDHFAHPIRPVWNCTFRRGFGRIVGGHDDDDFEV